MLGYCIEYNKSELNFTPKYITSVNVLYKEAKTWNPASESLIKLLDQSNYPTKGLQKK